MGKTLMTVAVASSMAAISITGAAQAADFATIKASKDSAILIDFDSRVMRGGIAKVWGLALEAKPRVESHVSKPYDYALGMNEYDCEGRRMRFGPTTYYVASGTSVGSVDGWCKWSDVIPSSVGERVLKGACAEDTRQFEVRFKSPSEALELYREVVGAPTNGK